MAIDTQPGLAGSDDAMTDATRHAGPGPALMGAGTLIGDDVYNAQDESLGEITEIMLDVHGGEVAYAVLSFGGFLGLGEKLFAVPWQALTLDTVNERFTLDVTRERLKEAPGFDADHWPDMADATWTNEVRSFYGVSLGPVDEVGSDGDVDPGSAVAPLTAPSESTTGRRSTNRTGLTPDSIQVD